jgi:hypothetical protein
LERDLKVKSKEDLIGPGTPTSPMDDVPGVSAYIDAAKCGLKGRYWLLPPGARLPDGLGVHADGKDVGGSYSWGHRTIYPTRQMSAGEFQKLLDSLEMQYGGNVKSKTGRDGSGK